MIFGAEPLFHKHGDKQGGQHKFNACKVDGDQFAGHIACDAESRSEIVVPLHAGAEVVGAGIVIEKAFQPGGDMLRAKGVRIEVAGRLNGAEMSRREKFIEGSVPLHTLRADIDFYCHHAPTIAGIVGVKVWIYKGEK